jgi:hypothetical protein
MRCPNCGSENQFEGAAFCRNCHEPLDAAPAENKNDSEDPKQSTDLNLQRASETDPQEPLDAAPAENKDDSEDPRQSTDLNLQRASETDPQEPLDAAPAENKDYSEDPKQSTDLNLQRPPEANPQEPAEDESLKLSDPIDFMINECPDDSSYYAGGSGEDTSRERPEDKPSDNRDDEFRLSISGGAVGSSVKLEEAINKAIEDMKISDDKPEQETSDPGPTQDSSQGSQEAPERHDVEQEGGSNVPDQEEPHVPPMDTGEQDQPEAARANPPERDNVQQKSPEMHHQDQGHSAGNDTDDTKDQIPQQKATVEDQVQQGQPAAVPDHHNIPPSPEPHIETESKEPVKPEPPFREDLPPTKKLQPKDQWNSVLSIKPQPGAAETGGAKDLPRVSRSKGVILLSGNNLILTGGRKVVSGDEVRIGDQSYEVRVKPEDNKRKIYMAAGGALLLIIIMLAIFAGGGNGRLVGILVDNNVSYPLAEQTVRIAELNRSVQTNMAGFFIFDDLSPGLYTLQYMNDGTVVSEVRVAILKGDLTTVTLHTNDSLTSISGKETPSNTQKKNLAQASRRPTGAT